MQLYDMDMFELELESYSLIVIYVVLMVAACLTIGRKNKREFTYMWPSLFLFCGATMIAGMAIWYLAATSGNTLAYAYEGPPVGTVPIEHDISAYGIGPAKHMMVINLTEIGGPQFIDYDDKTHAQMTTYVSGVKNTTYDIGVEIKGSGQCCGFKIALGIETWELDSDGEWDGKDTQISEFGFSREYEDYVIRRESSDPSMVLDGALLGAQPAYYDYTLVEVLYAVGETLTYEGTFYFVNNPAKKDSIPGAHKFKDTYPPHEPTYIVEWEYDTDDSCGLAGHRHVECKYPKPEKLKNYPAAKVWLEQLLTFENASQLDFPSLADEFVTQQAMLANDMQYRSMMYHVHDGKLKGGPMWDAEPFSDGYFYHWKPLAERYEEWVVLDDKYDMDWWVTWLKWYPQFAAAVRSSSALDTYWNSYLAADAEIREYMTSGEFAREQARWSYPRMQELDKQLAWHTKRYNWMHTHIGSFTESKVTYYQQGYWIWVIFTIAFSLLGVGVILGCWIACQKSASRASVAAETTSLMPARKNRPVVLRF